MIERSHEDLINDNSIIRPGLSMGMHVLWLWATHLNLGASSPPSDDKSIATALLTSQGYCEGEVFSKIDCAVGSKLAQYLVFCCLVVKWHFAEHKQLCGSWKLYICLSPGTNAKF